VVKGYFKTRQKTDLFGIKDEEALKAVGDVLRKGWTDGEAAKVVGACIEAFAGGQPINLPSLSGWVLLHNNDSAAVLDCMRIQPPEEISIIKVLSRAGSQKLVFLARWRLTQQQVVLKKITGLPEIANKLVARELRTNPLSMKHPNIIETHLLKNTDGEAFLVEKFIQPVLNDAWRSNGAQEAANLLYNIADATTFLHSQRLVHGDIKPDNIARDGEAYILLDFGICRPVAEFTGEITATGSLRTRAPELLQNNSYAVDPPKVDVWALAATVYNALAGRFPLIDAGEDIPRASDHGRRAEFERELARRSREEWSRRVDLSLVPDVIRPLLEEALEKDPGRRCTASDLMKHAEKELAALIRKPSDVGRFAPIDEYEQIKRYFPGRRIISLMPMTERQNLEQKLRGLSENDGFTDFQKRDIDRLICETVNP
jgi:serine/threonine protein kinase